MCFKHSQPQRIISGLRETFIQRYIVEMTNKAETRPEEQSEKTESCREDSWDGNTVERAIRQIQTQEQNKKVVGKLGWFMQQRRSSYIWGTVIGAVGQGRNCRNEAQVSGVPERLAKYRPTAKAGLTIRYLGHSARAIGQRQNYSRGRARVSGAPSPERLAKKYRRS